MGNTLREIAEQLQGSQKKVQLIYAFNGVGKTRLSREFKELIAPSTEDGEETATNIFYYSAFTEDLFYWDNDLTLDAERKLKIQPNGFTTWVIQDQGQDQNIISNFQHYTSAKLTPQFNADSSEVTFSLERGDDTSLDNLKISKGEESNFIWSIFYSLIEQVVGVLNEPEIEGRETDKFNELKYVFIDDPVTSLDENHLIELAVNLAQLITASSSNVKFIITTHNALFYNVLFNEFNLKKKKGSYMLTKEEDGTFELNEKPGDSNKSFSYHLHIKQTIEQAIEENAIEKYHFMLLRNLYEKTANFLDYPEWKALLPDDNKEGYYNRIIQFTSHSTLSNETVAQPTDPEKQTVKLLLEHLNTKFWQEGETDA